VTTVRLAFPSGRTADEVVVTGLAPLVWMVNLGCVDMNPHPVRADDLDHPDELRVDLDPGPGVGFEAVRAVALVVREALADVGLEGWPKTSGSRGIHVYVRLQRRWGFDEVRRAALALARDVERRAPELATSKWWKEERHGVFLDYNQNAKDRTVASAYSVRPTPEGRVSAPLSWGEVGSCELGEFTLATMPERYARLGDLMAAMDASPGSLEGLLDLAHRHEAEGQGDAPWPPHYRKQSGEAPRVQPSKRKDMPVVIVAKAAKKEDALAGLERWKDRHPEAARHLRDEDLLVDAMRGRFTTWTRIRLNLRHVPAEQRPPAEPPDPDYDPWEKMRSSS
jgi:DNA ligase D-like protein (predicted polymerase)